MWGQGEAGAWIALGRARGVGAIAAARLLARFGDAASVLAASAEELVGAGFASALAAAVARARHEDVSAAVAAVAALGARVVPCTDEEYPALLREIPDPPLYLVARGERLENVPAIAIVGARHATPYGVEVATRLAEDLAYAGVTIVSGLARGIDGAAHAGALRGGGHTVAVLGSGIDVIYPAEHAALAEAVARAGTLVSELPPGTPPLAEHFPQRNRIIAGMTHGTIVVEAADRSGSHITARLALDRGREVFAVPGRIDSPLSAGPHRLIQEGAKLVGDVDDVLAEIAPALRARGLTPVSRRPIGAAPRGTDAHDDEPLLPLLAAGPVPVDELIRMSGLPAGQVLTRILELELRGLVVQLPGSHLQLALQP
jgi:DNA processing protein